MKPTLCFYSIILYLKSRSKASAAEKKTEKNSLPGQVLIQTPEDIYLDEKKIDEIFVGITEAGTKTREGFLRYLGVCSDVRIAYKTLGSETDDYFDFLAAKSVDDGGLGQRGELMRDISDVPVLTDRKKIFRLDLVDRIKLLDDLSPDTKTSYSFSFFGSLLISLVCSTVLSAPFRRTGVLNVTSSVRASNRS